MILRRPYTILHVTTQRARSDSAQPFFVIDEAEVFLDLDVTDVMPVADLRRVELVKQRREFALARNFFVAASAFDSEPDLFRRSMLNYRFAASRLATASTFRRTYSRENISPVFASAMSGSVTGLIGMWPR